MSDTNPLIQVYDALWDLLEARQAFRELVSPGNRIKLRGKDRYPFKDEVSSADVPEVRLVPVGSSPFLQDTSNSTRVIERYEIQISTGNLLIETLCLVKFEIVRAMADWATKLRALTWNDAAFVHLARITAADDGVTQSDLMRGIRGWASLWACEVHLHFSTVNLISEE